MSTTSPAITNLARPAAARPLVGRRGWGWIGLLTALFVWMHWDFVWATYQFSKDPNWSHVIIVPLISLYYIFLHKERLAATPRRICWWALPLIVAGLYSYLFWIFPGRNDMFRGYSLVWTIFFTVLFLLGPAPMRILWFPILYLTLAVKISDAIWSRIAERLQDIASVGATWLLEGLAAVMSFTVDRQGNTITMGFLQDGVWQTEPMNVAEACAGLRMLMAFIALGVALAFLFDRTWWQRLIMISLAVPIAVAVNVGRVAALGVITTIDKDYAHGDFHLFVGMLMLIPAAGLFLLLGWILDRVVIREEPHDAAPAGSGASAATRSGAVGRANWVPSPAARGAAGMKRTGATPGVIVRGALIGAGLALTSGLSYAMAINSLSGRPLIEAISPTLSLVLMCLGLVLLVALLVTAVKLTPRSTEASTTPTTPRAAAPPAGLIPTTGADPTPPPSPSPPSPPGPASPAAAPAAAPPRRRGLWNLAGHRSPAALAYAAALICGVLAVAAAGQDVIIAWQKIVIHKEAVPLRHVLITSLPLEKDHYVFHEDQYLPPEVVDELGTKDYLSRTYRDLEIPEGQPGSFVRLHVAYYTGLVDTVPHVPDRCFVVGGADHKGLHAATLSLDPQRVTARDDGDGYTAYAGIDAPDNPPGDYGTLVTLPERDIEASRFTFGPPGREDTDQHVIYFFAANGKFLADPNEVRFQGFDIRDTHSYYCKIEVMIHGETDPQRVEERTAELLNTFLPEIMACLPDWQQVQQGEWPTPEAAKAD